MRGNLFTVLLFGKKCEIITYNKISLILQFIHEKPLIFLDI